MSSQIKIFLKYLFALAFFYSGACWLLSSLKRRRNRLWPLVLMYHRIIEPQDIEGLQPGMYVYKNVFAKQIEYLTKHFRILSANDFASDIEKYSGNPGDDIIITIDDGWRDNYTNGFPILQKYKASAAIYLTANFIGTRYMFWFQEISTILSKTDLDYYSLSEIIENVLNDYPGSDSARELLNQDIVSLLKERDKFIELLKPLELNITLEIVGELAKKGKNSPIDNNEERQLLNWDEILEMAKAGVEFGSHGLSHRLLDSLETAEVINELNESKKLIEMTLGQPIRSFTYPNGNYNGEIEKLVEKAGYVCAFIVGNNPAVQTKPDRFAIDRIGVHNGVSVNPLGKHSRAMFAFHLYRNL
jgi:peptidoglycan/xylan/chitin deacetylase (PgdA/CDA1 family)